MRFSRGGLRGRREGWNNCCCLMSLLTGNIQTAAWMKLRRFGIDGYFTPGAFGDDHHERECVRAGGDGARGGEELAAHGPTWLFDDLADAGAVIAALGETAG